MASGGWGRTNKHLQMQSISHRLCLLRQILLVSAASHLVLNLKSVTREEREGGRRERGGVVGGGKMGGEKDNEQNRMRGGKPLRQTTLFLQQIGREARRRWWQGQVAAVQVWQVHWVILVSSLSEVIFLLFFCLRLAGHRARGGGGRQKVCSLMAERQYCPCWSKGACHALPHSTDEHLGPRRGQTRPKR